LKVRNSQKIKNNAKALGSSTCVYEWNKKNKHLADILSKETKEIAKDRNQAEQANFHAFVARSSLLFYFPDKYNINYLYYRSSSI